MEKNKILIVEDDELMQEMLCTVLEKNGYDLTLTKDGEEGWNTFREKDFDLVLLDYKLPKTEGFSLLHKIKELSPEVIVIVMTSFSSVECAVKAIKMGAYDYISKPFHTEKLLIQVQRSLELQKLIQENMLLRKELKQRYTTGNMIGKSKTMLRVFDLIETISPEKCAILIEGESGTGKEMVAEMIHHLSTAKDKPFVKVSCATLTETLLESELFGHEKGAFTGALKTRKGRFELAQNGTIFLDDIDDLTLTGQTKLLRILQEKEYERVGGTETIQTNVRVIAASKTDLSQAVQKGMFREDLFYRLNVVPIILPPLRDRKDDVPLLLQYFLNKFNLQMKKKIVITPEALQLLLQYDFPGNVRELENLTERLVAVSHKDKIHTYNLPKHLQKPKQQNLGKLKESVKKAERESIIQTLKATNWKKKEAATILGITPKTLWEKINKYNIS